MDQYYVLDIEVITQ